MARMEFLSENRLNTTTQAKVDSNTVTAAYAFDRSTSLGYSSNGYNSDTSTIFSVEFAVPVVLSHLLLQNHNLKGFRVFYNSATANSLAVVTGNSATSYYLNFNSVTVSSIQVQMDTTVTGVEKSVGEIVVAERQIQFERNPSIQNWTPTVYRKQIEHEMPDGGTVLFNIQDKYQASLSWEFITQSFRDGLKTVYDAATPLYFLPFPTTTSWDGTAYESVWTGDFDFKHGTNDKTQGYSGSIVLKQTPSR